MEIVEASFCLVLANVANGAPSGITNSGKFNYNRIRISTDTAAKVHVHVRTDNVDPLAPVNALASPGQLTTVNANLAPETLQFGTMLSSSDFRLYHDNAAPVSFYLTFMRVKDLPGP